MSDRKGIDINAIREDDILHERFIDQNKRFILASAYKASGHYVTENDDEYSIALIAFEEAIKSFEPEKGNFYSFASLVIKRRIYDYNKSESRHNSEISVNGFTFDDTYEDEELSARDLEVRRKEAEMSMQNTDDRPESTPIRDEIEAMQQVLQKYGFSFYDLTECSPKAEKTKEACGAVIRNMLSEPELIRSMRHDRRIPVKKIHKNTGISHKILERHRKYIIAAVEILNGDYPELGEYLKTMKEAKQK